MEEEKTIKKRACKRCDHSWYPRSPEEPVTCPRCSSPYWSRDRVRRTKKKSSNGGDKKDE